MKKILSVSLLLTFVTISYSQDIIKTNSGEEYKGTILNLNRKSTTFKKSDDPEFSTFTVPYSELATIQRNGAKNPMYFNYKLPRAFISYSAGFTKPLGDFSKKSYSDTKNEPGFAQNGGNSNLEIGFYLYKKIGLNLNFTGSMNGFSYKDYDQSYISKYQDPFLPNATQNVYSSEALEGESKQWYLFGALIGPMYSVKVTKRITWDFMARIGVFNIKKPGIKLRHYGSDISGNNIDDVYLYQNDPAKSTGFNGATNIRIALSKRIGFIVSANYTQLKASVPTFFEYYQSTSSQYSTFDKGTIVTDYKIATLNLNAGFAILFNRKRNKYE